MKGDDHRYIEQHVLDAGRVELRAFFPHIMSGHFDDPQKLIETVYDLRHDAELYYSCQAPKLARPVKNDMGHGGALKDEDIAHRVRVVIDIDSAHEKGVLATQQQIIDCGFVVDDIRAWLESQGFPQPVLIFSGNGFHLIYRILPLAHNPQTDEVLKKFYLGLAARFDNDHATVDPVVRNASRIMRIPLSANRKAEDPETGRYRLCLVQKYPDDWQTVTVHALVRVAELLSNHSGQTEKRQFPKAQPLPAAPPGQRGDYSTLDVVRWFDAHGLYIRHISGNTHAVVCPWNDEHTTDSPPHGGDTVIFEGGGDDWPGFHCHHSHCEGRRVRDVMQIWGDADQFCSRRFTPRNSESGHVDSGVSR